MTPATLAKRLEREILPLVEKPSRYLGTEINAVHKDLAEVEVRLALIFPDLYDLGLGNLGLHILYAVLNQLPWCWAERGYAPAPDMEAALRERGMPLFALESKTPLGDFDGLGFTLQSELTYTNILNCLDLSGVPLRSADRGEHHPLVFAGGPAVFNPEPLAPFMDFFVIGDGEDMIVELAQLLRQLKADGASRSQRLAEIAEIEGVYVPALYPMETLPDGRILPPIDGPKIVKRITRDLDGATFPVNYLVPFTAQVHDRISLEVLRGCTQGCRFCQAGMTTRPVRERSLENIDSLLKRTLETTGYEEVSLVSLSTCDYSRVKQLVDQSVSRAEKSRVSISLPSLRLDSFSVDLADRVADVRRTGLTVAPEAASPRLRALINKWIPDEGLLEMADQAYSLGWGHVKLYFMIGLPTERDDDIEAIADLTLRTLEVGRKHNPRARVNTGVSTFVPKPFTPFQWAPQLNMAETERRQRILIDRFGRNRGVKFGRHNPEETFLEGLVSRADRRAADLIEAAFREGARLDAWYEHLDFSAWQRAIEATGYDVEYALRERAIDERLPWDHIDIMIPKEWFQEDWKRAMLLQYAEDCRHAKCLRCGVIDRERPLCAHMLRNSIAGAKEDGTFKMGAGRQAPLDRETARIRKKLDPAAGRLEEPDPVQRIRMRVTRTEELRFLSHLETMNAWLRALRRAKVPLSYSRGYHPHPKVSFSTAFPVGESSTGDYMDVILVKRMDPTELREALSAVLPNGMDVVTAREVPLGSPSLMSQVAGFDYILHVHGRTKDALDIQVNALMGAAHLPLERRAKRRGRRVMVTHDMRPGIVDLTVGDAATDDRVALHFRSQTVDGRTTRAKDLLRLLDLTPERVDVLRRDTLFM
jgi:radical SAM family uncharacterized protein/radical SAM-linked protein